MDTYINKLNFDFVTNQKILKLIAHIDLYKGKWNSIEKQETKYLQELRRIATVESIGSSTRIEGTTLTNSEIHTLLNNLKITKLQTRDEQEVIGYYDTLELIYEHYPDIQLSENYIKQLHQTLLAHSDKDIRHRGNYKSLSNKVVAKYPEGVEKVIFNTTEVHLVANEMQTLIQWTNEQCKKQDIHILIVIALFVYEFLSIHPFQDGNGRLSRLLTTLLLLQNNYQFVQYVSFENLIESTKKSYYKALMAGQQNRNTDSENIAQWLLYFLDKLNILTQKLDAKYDVLKAKGGYLNARQQRVFDCINEYQPVKVSDISQYLEDISINTIKKDIQYLRQEQMITRIGKGRGTVYIISQEDKE